MKFVCPNCSQHLDADAAWAGRQINCPTCSASFTIPVDDVRVPEVSGSPTAVEGPSPARRRKSKVPMLAAAAIILILTVIAGAWWLTRGQSGSGSLASIFAFLDRPDLTDVKVFPTEVHLGTKQDRQSVVVQATYADGATRDVTRDASLSLANKSVVRMDKEALYPISDGKTELHVKFGGKSLTVPVT